MKYVFLPLVFLALISLTIDGSAQKRRRVSVKPAKPIAAKSNNSAVIVDERLAVLRSEPSFYGKVITRMRRGRTVSISGSREADGVTFFRVAALPSNYGWLQADAVAGKFRRGDDGRLAKLVQSSEGFEQLDRARIFLDIYDDSALRPAILLLMGDSAEETALDLSVRATRQLKRREMAASGAPLHSFYLNFVMLDRFRKLGVNFLFNSNTKLFHYDGASWQEIIKKLPKSAEAIEAQKRLDALKNKMERKS